MYYLLKNTNLPLYYNSAVRTLVKKEDRPRIIDNILKLRRQLAREIPLRTVKDTLLLATWNLRDFGKKGFNPSPRLTESLFYIAEIISAFDIVALQEINEDLAEFNQLMRILGPSWKFMATDVSGNGERMVFVYDQNKVYFQNIASEIVLKGVEQFNRTPYLVKFQTGWLKFNLCSVHLFFGDDDKEGYERRIREIDYVAGFLAERAAKERKKNEEENYILLGDMNIVSPQDRTMKALRKHKFVLPSDITKKELPTNMKQDKYYDQIAFLQRQGELELGNSKNNAGIFNFYETVFQPGEFEIYYNMATNRNNRNKKDKLIWGETDNEKKKYFTDNWRTWQMSDHLPLWVELKVDFTDKYLKILKET